MKSEELKEGMIVWRPIIYTFIPSYKLKKGVILKVSKRTVLLEDYESGKRSRVSKDFVINYMFSTKKEALEWVIKRLDKDHKYHRKKAKELSRLKARAKKAIKRLEVRE